MRPTDENQQSTRPNLMSSGKRGGNEESILAMLERDSGRGGGLRTSRLALYGVAGVLAAGLVGVLVWLARDQGSTEVIIAQAPVPVLAAGTVPEQAPDAASAPHLAQADATAHPPQAAVIVDEPEPAARTEPRPDAPPLVLLDPEKAEQRGAAAAGAKAAETASVADVQSSATTPADTAAAARPEASPAPAIAARAEPKRAARPPAGQDSARAKPAARPAAKAPAASARLASRHAHRQEARAKKQAPPPQPAERVDSDVALISAVIQHASNRANAESGECGPDARCAEKTTSQE